MAIVQGLVQTPANYPAGTSPYVIQGRQGDLGVSEVHGKYYNANMSGRMYIASALIAGVTIPVNTSTSPTFTLFNPVNSGVNLEVMHVSIGWPAAATTVVATILGSISKQTPTSTTSLALVSLNPANQQAVPNAAVYTAATITAITAHIPLFQITSTADAEVNMFYDFDGRLVLPPGWLITLTSTPVQTGVALPSITWAEWPV